ncbi:uncharacterized protein LOC109612852 [Musca domestica]|uniref:Uncharacterized protein LOC109612852 n=1 Tax=Musca domestica TaxID=7370 RepID=A0ABM3VKA1_MUSDO|nr:uncharacterized protein LOC109612852 [Musca domestica]
MNSWYLVLVALSFSNAAALKLRFTNVKCEDLRPDFSQFKKCRLAVVKRDVISLNLEVKLLQVPVGNVTVNLSFYKKLNGYRPFLYNITHDFCWFMENRKRIMLAKIILDLFLKKSNINHTCPFDHNIIVDNVILHESQFKLLPFPRGDYMMQVKVAAYNDWKAVVKMYLGIYQDL